MNHPTHYPAPLAWSIAENLWRYFAPLCQPQRYEVAGALRRLRDDLTGFRQAQVSSIDLVLDLTADLSMFKARLAQLSISNHTGKARKHAFTLHTRGVSIPVQIHLATTLATLQWGTVSNYGWLLLLYTGDDSFSRLLVTHQPYGLRPFHIHKAEGGPTEGFLHINGIPQDTPTEQAAFALHRLGYVRPCQRNAETAYRLADLLKPQAYL
jgi:hypothetical protein